MPGTKRSLAIPIYILVLLVWTPANFNRRNFRNVVSKIVSLWSFIDWFNVKSKIQNCLNKKPKHGLESRVYDFCRERNVRWRYLFIFWVHWPELKGISTDGTFTILSQKSIAYGVLLINLTSNRKSKFVWTRILNMGSNLEFKNFAGNETFVGDNYL